MREQNAIPIVEAKGLSKWFGEVVAVNNLNVALEPGVTGLLGPNGAGKTTFIRLVLGLYGPSRGEIRVFGESPRNNLGVLRRIGFCPESDAFYEGMTGFQFVTWLCRYWGMPRVRAREAALIACERLGMTSRMNDPITTYSKGMRQRIKIAQALALEPELIVLDEPMQGLDPEGREEMFHLIKQLAAEGRSVLVSSHILYEIERVTNNVLVLRHGCVLAHGPVREIRDLIDEHPHAVTLEGRDVRRVADEFIHDPATLAIEFNDRGATIRTGDPNAFYERLNALVLKENLQISSIQCTDDDLQSVFEYLVHRGRHHVVET
ncbi:MAG: ABC transporter ATP-binding protein [Candidatus Hydrogenedentota bacterium]